MGDDNKIAAVDKTEQSEDVAGERHPDFSDIVRVHQLLEVLSRDFRVQFLYGPQRPQNLIGLFLIQALDILSGWLFAALGFVEQDSHRPIS